uniref:Uncharacterized protein n=1 Tax=Arundo donax TaxID=35708 RepID=A0A0A9CCM6_ARUDO
MHGVINSMPCTSPGTVTTMHHDYLKSVMLIQPCHHCINILLALAFIVK